jgi:Tol biopolymer transport system component
VAYIADRNIWLMQGTSANLRRLTHSGDLDGQVFRLTSDGSYVLFTRATTDTVAQAADESAPLPFNSLWMVDTAAGGATPVQVDVENILWADWEPGCSRGSMGEGCHIAYATGAPAAGNPGWRAENDLWIARPNPLDGRLLDARRIVGRSSGGAYGWWGTTYAWSPDGHHLAYARADEIGTVSVAAATSATLLRFPPYRTYAPWVWTPTLSWSPDGSFLITALHTPAAAEGSPEDSLEFDIWAIAADGAINAHLVDDAGMWAAPQCAHRGDMVAYGQARDPGASRTSGYDLYVMDRDGSDQRLLFPPAQELGLDYPEVAWDPSGDRLIVIYRGDLTMITLGDGQASPLTAGSRATAVQWR